MRRVSARIMVAALLITALTGCSHAAKQDGAPASADPNLLAGCGPVEDQKLASAIAVTNMRQLSAPTICDWTASNPGGGAVDLTYAWLRDDTLAREVQIAGQFGYRIERLVVKNFGGMYWRDPKDPGSCAVTVADTGTVTWWVHNRDHAARPDPCAAAMTLMNAVLSVDGV
ncbi:DUF3558 domain-containing protein [Nocardia yunnanensis]|uniref:DUF3558 domain-containing protein n=1 Tax=Nocardia yunnanensis TaxID=2382165 RepID=A0A386ZLD9_9NOCA|nr:DUF3558 family protein [Nocardia yunnanensis]AYF78103.1 DUF3558 domain-containing protein [Nocardia yunnanensis]